MYRLSVSVVNYYSDRQRLIGTIRSVHAAIGVALATGSLKEATLTLIDNEPASKEAGSLDKLASELGVRLLSGHGNLGFGKAHNLALFASEADFHLFLNPDILMEEDAIEKAIAFLHKHPTVALLSPAMIDDKGERQYPCKRYPSVLDLALRGFAPAWLKRRFARRLARYEMRDLPTAQPSRVPLLSGACLFCRRAQVEKIGGFCEAFFVYFEDFDLSIRVQDQGSLVYAPDIQVIHSGGYAASKGLRHIYLFTTAAFCFFRRHGWKWC